MCGIPVNLPTVASFLMLYSLRCGCIVIFFWTLFRSLFFLGFFIITLMFMYMPESEHTDSQPENSDFMYVFLPYLLLIITESFVFIGAICLGLGVFCENSLRLAEYMVCRFCALVFEAACLLTLCFHHHYYIGWYLVFLMIIILEIYAFIVVYSYYVDLKFDEERAREETEMKSDAYPNYEICENYANMPDRRNEVYPLETGASLETRDSADTPDTRDMKRDPRTSSGFRLTREPENRGSRRNPQEANVYMSEKYRPAYPD